MSKRLSIFFALVFAVVLSSSFVFFQDTPVEKSDAPQLMSDTISPKTAGKLSSHKRDRVKRHIGKDSPNLFAEWHNGIRTRPGAAGPDYPHNYKVKELLKARKVNTVKELSLLKSSNRLNWIERGPGNVAGRTRAILVDPRDSNYDTWIVGSVGGGVWKTSDAGQTWTHLTAGLPNLATSTLASSASAPNTIYVGTGEGFGNVDQIDGTGIWKSTDGGTSWSQLISTVSNTDFENIMRMVVDPANANAVVAAVAPGFYSDGISGIYRSTDGGGSWTKTYTSTGPDVQDLVADPNNFNNLYAALNGTGVIKSTDGGQTWASSSSGIGGVGRIELAVAPSNSNKIYAAAQGGVSGSILYISDDAGANWAPGNDPIENIHWLGGQGWYDNTIAVHPYDDKQVFVGGIDLFRLETTAGTDTIGPTVTGIDFENTASFLSLINFSGSLAGGGIDKGDADESDFTTVEVRFGQGKSQKAHRFLVPVGATSGVAASQYAYQDYVDVPFELWDTDNNQQLMIAFRDQSRNGAWELQPDDSPSRELAREYVYLSAEPYNATTPNASMAQAGGHEHRNLYFIWPVLADGGSFDPNSLPEAIIRLNWGTIITKGIETSVVTDGYGRNGGFSRGVHVDHHNITLIGTDAATQSFRLINGNDGGVAYTDDGTTFFQTGDTFGNGINGYNTTQFYGVDKAPGVDRYIGGLQDNGSWVSPLDADATSVWEDAPSGDGFEAVWHYKDVNKMLESSQYNFIFRSNDGGSNWLAKSPPDNGQLTAPFFTKIAKSKQDPDLVFAIGVSGVWRSDDFADNWSLITMPQGFNGSNSFSHIKISLASPQVVWTARNNTASSPPYVSTDGGFTFAPTNVYSEVGMGRISGLETHPTDENTAYILSGIRGLPKILRTTDLGQTWEDISGFGSTGTSSAGFPDVTVYSLLVMPYNTDIIWAGTDIGIFETTDGGASWAYAANGLEAAAVYEMLIVNDEVVVATHGRGVWTVSLTELAGYEPPAAILSPRMTAAGGAGGVVTLNINMPSAYDSSSVFVDGELLVSFAANAADLDTVFSEVLPVSELTTATFTMFSYKDGKELRSANSEVTLFPASSAQSGYVEDFNDIAADFILTGAGWKISKRFGFSDHSLHSPHDYPNNADLIALLAVRLLVAKGDAVLEYDDIAIVEPGESGAAFGSSRFYDYVVVEGSNDNGETWKPLLLGYDARFDAAWLDAWNAGGFPSTDMFRKHEIDLLDHFSAGEEVFLRWRLFSNNTESGFGWMIDNIKYKDQLVSVGTEAFVTADYSLTENYPNPFNPSTKINYTLPEAAEVTLSVFNITGQKIRDLVQNEKKSAGRYTISWDGTDFSGRPVSSGLYFYSIKAGEFTKSFKMTLLK